MKKIVIIFIICIAILGTFWYIYEENKIVTNQKIAYNKKYEDLYETPIYGNSLASLINESIDNNEKNNISKDKRGLYIDDGKKSLKIEVKFLDNPNVFKGEVLYKNDISKFIELYSNSKFELKTINYHKDTNRVKYLYFEEVE